jgi:hypothetical protein
MKIYDIIVILSWTLAGIVFYYLSQDDPASTDANNTIGSRNVYGNNDKRRIYLDWPYDSDKFSYLNYKSLESFLVHVYNPDTAIEVIIVADDVAGSYKVKHILR